MVIAALAAFGTLLIAWLLAPDRHATPAAAIEHDPEPLPATA